MDSRDLVPPPLQAPPQPPPSQVPPNMRMGPTSYPTTMPTTNTSTMINPNSNSMIPPNAGFPFNSVVQSSPSSKPFDSFNSNAFDGSSTQEMRSGGFSIEPAKKKRGRPRKYTSDGNIALGLAPTPMSNSSVAHGDSSGGGGSGSGNGTPASEAPSKRHRGRPPGLGKKQLDALGAGGLGFTPHVITVKAGEDIGSKVMSFSQQGPRTICILSANGAVCNVTLRQPATSGGTVTYEGRFEIISLSGSFLLSENNGNRSRTGGLSVSLAGSDGRVFGGGVAGMLMAASPVQVIVGSFIADGKKSKSSASKSGPSITPPASNMLNFGGPVNSGSPSQGASSESSDENGSSPMNRNSGLYGNSGGQPIHGMQMYHQLWAGQTQQ